MRKIVLFVLGLMAITVQADEIRIESESDLRALANSGKTYAGDVIKLTSDIVLESGNWTPIGTPGKPFQGTFDGQGHSITGIKIDYDSKIEYTGLFGYIGSSGKVCNVRINMPTDEDNEDDEDDTNFIIFSAGKNNQSCYVGGIAGWNEGTISKCVVTTPVSAIHVNAVGGGIAGRNYGMIENCYVMSNIYAAGGSNIVLGGIVGSNNGTLRNCWIKGTVDGAPQTARDYICGSGSYTGCFYANGSSANVSLSNTGDNSSILSSKNGATNQSVLLNGRTLFTNNSWNTLCLPFDIAASSEGLPPIAGAKVMEMTSARLTENLLSIYFSDVTTIEAGKPYLIKWTDTNINNIMNPVFLNVTCADKTESERTVTINNVSFIGTFSSVPFTANDQSIRYVGSNNYLYYPSIDMSIGSCRAYFQFDKQVASRQATLCFDEGMTTAVNMIKNNESNDDHWYNLNGSQLTGKPTTRGIFLHQGKKIVIK